MSQNRVFDSAGKKIRFQSEDVDIYFTVPAKPVRTPGEETPEMGAGTLIPVLPTLLNAAFQVTTDLLETRAREFTAEYTKSKSFLGAAGGVVPEVRFVRTVDTGAGDTEALSILLKPEIVPKLAGFIYHVESIALNYSSARTKAGHNTMDYTIEIRPTFLTGGQKKAVEVAPLTISSVKFNVPNTYGDFKHRTEIIALPANGCLTEISLKVIESNPVKVRAEKILKSWNAYKDSTRTIIKTYLPKEGKKPAAAGAAGKNDSDQNQPE